MHHRSHETLAPKTSELVPARRSAAPEPDVTQPSHLNPLSRVAPGAGGAPPAQAQAAALNRASGGQLARTGPALLQLQRQYGNHYVQRVVSHAGEGSLGAPEQKANQTGLPDRLKAGIENLSGLSLDDVHVHYNSSKPARLAALAYTQGTDIHVGPGQEKHLAHEAWHVVQQRQGRVRPTMQFEGVALNDDTALEQEADVMGRHASHGAVTGTPTGPGASPGSLQETSSLRPVAPVSATSGPIQRTVDTAAEALLKQGVIKVKKTDLSGKFAKTHNVSGSDLEGVQTALNALRANKPVAPKAATKNVRNPADRPTTGGMMEVDAAVIAELNGWTESGKDWKCSDSSHTPKGKVYTDGTIYYGADNTGHVGWGFKVWTKKNATTLTYAGNTVWDGADWQYISRGT